VKYLRIQKQWKLLTSDQIASSRVLQNIEGMIDNDVQWNDRQQEVFMEDDNPHLRFFQRILIDSAFLNRDGGYVELMNDFLSRLIVLFIIE
jgi:hypothetical protein